VLNRKKALVGALVVGGIAASAAVIPMVAGGNARTKFSPTAAAQAALNRPSTARLLGTNEFPGPGDPDGSGGAAVTIDTATGEICYDVSVAGIATPNAAHIHSGAAGTAGPIVVNFNPPAPDTASACTTVTAVLAGQIAAAPQNFYVNVHNGDFPNGAVRGQLAAGAEPSGAIHLLPTPLRAYDSRVPGESKLAGGATRVVSLLAARDNAGAIHLAVPPGATGALVTLNANETVGSGFLKLYSNASPEPATSNLNWGLPNSSVAVNQTVAVDALGRVKVTNGPNATHFILDVVGYTY
jgi:hypothetical protein